MNQEQQQIPMPDIPMPAGCRRMPVLGFGTAADPPVEREIVRTAVIEAIEVGYRHFDTADLYNSEEPLGEAIIEAINGGLVESREQLFITSKLWCSDAHPQHVLPALNKTLRNLKMDYIDLYVIHWPVEVSPCWQQQKKLREFCKRNGVIVVGYGPLGSIGTFYGTNRVMESEVLKEIAKARGKTIAQVALRWGYEQGIGVVVKSYNKERMKQNLEIFDWSLSDDDCRKISEIPQSRAVLGKDYTSPYGPYKTIEELWDEEL